MTKLRGTALVLATDGADLYYHWLFQALPRLELARMAGFEPESFDHIIVNTIRHRFQSDSLKALSIAGPKILEAGEQAHYRADRLIVPSIALEDGNFPAWMTGMLRRTFLGSQEKFSDRTIYIARGKARYRRVMNEDEVISFMRSRNFEIVQMEQYSIAEQAAIMAQSKAVVAPHGGGLSNLVYCSPKTTVVELFSPELVAGYYWKLSNRMGLDYYYVLGRGAPGREKADYRQSWDARSDIVVDLDELKSTLDLAGL